MGLFDSHTHVFAPEQRERRQELAGREALFAEMFGLAEAKMVGFGELHRTMAKAGLDGAAVAGFAFESAAEIEVQNEYLLAGARECSGVRALCTVNPASDGWEGTARNAIDGGASGFGELRPGNQGWDPLGAAGIRLCGMAEDAGMVLLWHMSEPVGHTYPGKQGGASAQEVYEIAVRFPRLRMIAAHLGGGLSFFLQMPEVRAALTNVWFDTAASGLLYDPQSVIRLVDLAGPGRVLFGSDYPLLSPRRQLQRINTLLQGDVATAVCGGNAENLFSDKRDA